MPSLSKKFLLATAYYKSGKYNSKLYSLERTFGVPFYRTRPLPSNIPSSVPDSVYLLYTVPCRPTRAVGRGSVTPQDKNSDGK